MASSAAPAAAVQDCKVAGPSTQPAEASTQQPPARPASAPPGRAGFISISKSLEELSPPLATAPELVAAGESPPVPAATGAVGTPAEAASGTTAAAGIPLAGGPVKDS